MNFFEMLKRNHQGYGKGFGQMNGTEGAVLGGGAPDVGTPLANFMNTLVMSKHMGEATGAELNRLNQARPSYSEALKRLQGLELQAGPPSDAEVEMLQSIVQQGPRSGYPEEFDPRMMLKRPSYGFDPRMLRKGLL